MSSFVTHLNSTDPIYYSSHQELKFTEVLLAVGLLQRKPRLTFTVVTAVAVSFRLNYIVRLT
jgi:hypothetical protein